MNAFAKIDPDTFFRFAAEHAEQRYELDKGVIVQQMTGGTKRHTIVALRLASSLMAQVSEEMWSVLMERGIKIDASGRYADVVIEPADEPGESLRTERPILIVEILSPTTAANDRNTKALEYLAIPTLDVYVIASQTEPAILVYERGTDGTFPREPVAIDGATAARLRTRSFTVSLNLAEIYEGIA